MAVLKPFQVLVVKGILESYKFDQPFHRFFTSLSRENRNWGSKDRKTYRQACYAWFRCGHLFKEQITADNIIKASEIVSQSSGIVAEELFPFRNLVSPAIDFDAWALSHLYQRPLYLKPREGKMEQVRQALDQAQIGYEIIQTPLCFKLAADSKCEFLIEKGWVWVMDMASQMAASTLQVQKGESVWDACSGAGGKSLYLRNEFGDDFKLVCSDKRISVLQNLEQRFKTLELRAPVTYTVDLTEDSQDSNLYDRILLDVPCSGSGTWGRSPESILNFTQEVPQKYALVQKAIFRNALKRLKPGGVLYYVTCSVFNAENEDNVKYFEINHDLKCNSEKYHFGDMNTTDVLFSAQFVRN